MHPLLKSAMATVLAAAFLAPVPAVATTEKEWLAAPTSFQITGSGWGHGVGMSQYGSRGMAQAGKNAEQILEHYYSPALLTKETRYATSDIRVQVLHASTATMSVTGGSARIRDGKLTRIAKSSLSYQVVDGKIRYTIDGKVYTAGGKISVEWEGTRAWGSTKKAVVSVQRANDGFGAVAYRHGFMNIGVLSGKVNIVNQVRLNDEYLYGLAEVPSSWEPASLQAQAIAGRTYAMKNMSGLKSACDCNVYDEVASQKFTAWNKENEGGGTVGSRWKAAVEGTVVRSGGTIASAGVVKHQGSLIDAVYSSSTGGKTRSAKSVWGYDHAYLQSRDDSWALKSSVNNPNGNWSRSITQSQAKNAFGLNEVVAIKVAKSADLSIASATATSKDGRQATLTGSRFRSLVGAKAAWVGSVAPVGGVQQAPASPSPVQSTAKGISYQTTAKLNLRGEPVDGAVLQVLGESVNVLTTGKAAHAHSWVEVSVGGKTGWVSKAYLRLVPAPAKPAPAKPAPAKPAPAKPAPAKPAPKPVSKPAPAKTVTKHTTTVALNLRSSATNGKILLTMKKGSTITLTGKTAAKGTWVQAKFNGKTGWAAKKHIKTTTTLSNKKQTNSTRITTTNLNLRAGASTKHKIVTTIKKGQKVTPLEAPKVGWTKVKYGKQTGHVSSRYLN